MPLKGEAKRQWQERYDRERRSTARAVKQRVSELVLSQAPGRAIARAITDGAKQHLQTVLKEQGLLPTLVVAKVRQKLDATRPYMLAVEGERGTRVVHEGDDNDAQLRACELAIKLHERAGTIPSGGDGIGPTSSGARVRMMQIEPDGTERIIEIG